jgi:hypothetical protein
MKSPAHTFALSLLVTLYVAVAHGAGQPALSIDSPIFDLLEDARTRPVIERHLPKLAQRLLEDPSAAEFFGNSTLRELAADPHVRGITDEILQQVKADLRAVQAPP